MRYEGTLIAHAKCVFSSLFQVLFPLRHYARKAASVTLAHIHTLTSPKMHYGHETLLSYRNQEVRDILFACKYEAHGHSIAIIAEVLGRVLIDKVADHTGAVLVTTIPPSVVRTKKDGYSHLFRIAKRLRKMQPQLPIVTEGVLRYTRTIARQSTVRDRLARKKNVKHALVADTRYVSGVTCYVFDDVVTTGATLDEAKRALLDAGAVAVYTVAFARTV